MLDSFAGLAVEFELLDESLVLAGVSGSTWTVKKYVMLKELFQIINLIILLWKWWDASCLQKYALIFISSK